MSFVIFATGSASCSRVRTVSSGVLALAAGAVAAALLAGGVALGSWLAGSPPPVTAAAAPPAAQAPSPFALEQIGTLSARLFKLESQASQLGRRLGMLPASRPASPPSSAATGSGGPWLPPREEAVTLQQRIDELEQQMARLAELSAERGEALMRLPTRLPVDEPSVASGFGNREDPFTGHRAFHSGLDFAAGTGTPVHAAAGGRVAFAGFRPDFGWMVEIDHGNGLATRYAHASKLLVGVGAWVAPGDRIALVGSTGRSTGAHLHFEVLRHGEPTDPRGWLAGL